MKFSAVFLAGSATALVAPRDLATIKGVVANVQTGVDSLKTVAEAFNGNTAPVVTSSNNLVTTINNGKTTVDGTSNISTADTVALITPVKELKNHAQALSDAFLARRGDVEAAKACGLTSSQLAKIKTASEALIVSITAKVPDAAKGIAKEQADQITAVLNQAETNFNSANCHDAA